MTFEPWAVDMGVSEQSITVPITVAEIIGEIIEDFTGPYQITPTQETQTLEIRGMRATADIVVDPIPSNYGLITWNGSTLTVS